MWIIREIVRKGTIITNNLRANYYKINGFSVDCYKTYYSSQYPPQHICNHLATLISKEIEEKYQNINPFFLGLVKYFFWEDVLL